MTKDLFSSTYTFQWSTAKCLLVVRLLSSVLDVQKCWSNTLEIHSMVCFPCFAKYTAQNRFTSIGYHAANVRLYWYFALHCTKEKRSCNKLQYQFYGKRKPLKCATNEYNIIHNIRAYVYVNAQNIYTLFCGVFFMAAEKEALSQCIKPARRQQERIAAAATTKQKCWTQDVWPFSRVFSSSSSSYVANSTEKLR